MFRSAALVVLLVAGLAQAKIKQNDECSTLRSIFARTPEAYKTALRCGGLNSDPCSVFGGFHINDIRDALFDLEQLLGCMDETKPISVKDACQLMDDLPKASVKSILDLYVMNAKGSWHNAAVKAIPRLENATRQLIQPLWETVCA